MAKIPHFAAFLLIYTARRWISSIPELIIVLPGRGLRPFLYLMTCQIITIELKRKYFGGQRGPIRS